MFKIKDLDLVTISLSINNLVQNAVFLDNFSSSLSLDICTLTNH